MKKIKIITVLVSSTLLFIISGCSSFGTYNAATGRNEVILISTPSEIAMGKALHKKIIRQQKLSTNQSQIKRIEAIGARLVQVSDRQDYQYHFYLIDRNELNAFTIPGGNVYIYSGLVNRLKNDDQIASVLAHEIGHCAAKHTVKKFQTAMGYNLVGSLVFNYFEMGALSKKVAQMSSKTVMNLVSSAYSRKDEYEADRLGVKYLYLAKYDMQGAVDSLGLLKQASKGPKTPIMLRSHPYLESRIKFVKEEIEQMNNQFANKFKNGRL